MKWKCSKNVGLSELRKFTNAQHTDSVTDHQMSLLDWDPWQSEKRSSSRSRRNIERHLTQQTLTLVTNSRPRLIIKSSSTSASSSPWPSSVWFSTRRYIRCYSQSTAHWHRSMRSRKNCPLTCRKLSFCQKKCLPQIQILRLKIPYFVEFKSTINILNTNNFIYPKLAWLYVGKIHMCASFAFPTHHAAANANCYNKKS